MIMNALAAENFELTEKLRNEDPEQFYTLVRMHLSFVLDLNTDDCDNSEKKNKISKWNLLFSKKSKPGAKTSLDASMTVEFIMQMKPLIEFLRKEENISQEGIFRRSGKVTRQQELKSLLQQGVILNFDDNQFSVHECATVLKNILSELPESVLTDAHYPAYCQIAEFCSSKNQHHKERLLRAIQLLILLLPNENRIFFKELIELLHLAFTQENRNRMSADNLATVFTPHLLCLRKLSPEAFHTNSQIMSKVVAFMIKKGSELFEIPPTVATDVKAYWKKKEKKKLSPLKQVNESICDGTAANTVFTFVDRQKTAEENKTNPTETALAQLYAYIQSLPESSKKRKLIKQFNKENGYGTPLRTIAAKKRLKTINLGDSFKKHFNKASKRNINSKILNGEDEEIFGPVSCSHIKREQVADIQKFQKDTEVFLKKPSLLKPVRNKETLISTSIGTPVASVKQESKFFSSLNLEETSKKSPVNNSYDSSDFHQFLPIKLGSKRSSPPQTEEISSPKSCYLPEELEIQNELKNSLSSAEIDDSHPSIVSNCNQALVPDENFNSGNFSDGAKNKNNKSQVSTRANEDKEFLKIGFDIKDNLMCRGPIPIQKFCNSSKIRMANNDDFLSPPNNTNHSILSLGSKSFLMATSTPAVPSGNACLLTPIVDKNNSMSPITKSTRRMPKAMQETMMTPRSRKPVISLSGTDLSSLVNECEYEGVNCDSYEKKEKISLIGKTLLMTGDSTENVSDSLSSPFRHYLLSRSVLTASPVDLSFSSRADDFLSLSEKTSSPENGDDFKILPEMLNETELSESLLFCLDGNEPGVGGKAGRNSGNQTGDCSCSSYSDCDENLKKVYETAL